MDEAQRLGILGTVSDEGDFRETRSLERLTKEIGDQSAMLAGFLGALKDAEETTNARPNQPNPGSPDQSSQQVDWGEKRRFWRCLRWWEERLRIWSRPLDSSLS